MKLGSVSLVTALAVALVSQVNGQSSSDASEQLQKIEKQWAASAQKQDVSFIDSVWVTDFELTNPVGQVVPKSVLIDKLKDGSFKVESFEYATMKVRTYGATGIVTGRLTIKATWDGNDVGGEYAFTDTFVKQGGKWREVASQVTRVEG